MQLFLRAAAGVPVYCAPPTNPLPPILPNASFPPCVASYHGVLFRPRFLSPSYPCCYYYGNSYFACSLLLHLIVTYWERDLVLATTPNVRDVCLPACCSIAPPSPHTFPLCLLFDFLSCIGVSYACSVRVERDGVSSWLSLIKNTSIGLTHEGMNRLMN